MRSRNSLMRERREAFRDARLIVIASEGKDTERIYFKALAKEYTTPVCMCIFWNGVKPSRTTPVQNTS